MGLDGVELVMAVEGRFGVKLPDSECSHVRTVADLAALVMAKLPRPSESLCRSARTFYNLRSLLVSEADVPRREVRPGARLDGLIGAASRPRAWSRLRRADRSLPRLALSSRLDKVMLWGSAIVISSLPIGAGVAWGSLGGWAAVGWIAMWGVALGLTSVMVDRFLARELPPGLITVADLVRAIMPIEVPAESSGRRLVAQQRVLEEVRRLTSEQLGIPIEKVKPESDFVRDLDLD